MFEQGELQILLGVEYWTCKVYPLYIYQARSQGLVLVEPLENHQQHVWNVSFPCGTKHVVGTFGSPGSSFEMHVFRTPEGYYWGVRVAVPGRMIRTMEPLETKFQQEATRLVERAQSIPLVV